MEAWTLAARTRQVRLSPQMVQADLADLGVDVESVRLRRVLLGVEPAEPELLEALVDVLQLRDRALPDAQVLTAVARPWHAAGHRIPPRVCQILAQARVLTARQVVLAVHPGSS